MPILSKSTIMCSALFLLTMPLLAQALQCYVCNSLKAPASTAQQQPDCPQCLKSTQNHTKISGSHWYRGDACLPGKLNQDSLQTCSDNFTACLTLYQEASGIQPRYIRQCSVSDGNDLKCLDRTGVVGVKVKICKCNGNACNEATSLGSYCVWHVLALLLMRLLQ